MLTPFSALLANLPPPETRVLIPPGRETWHEIAAPLFFSLAIAFGGWWLLRSRTIQTTWSRVLLLGSSGCLAASYVAAWIWTNRGRNLPKRSAEMAIAESMPMVWFSLCLLAFLCIRRRIGIQSIKRSRYKAETNLAIYMAIVVALCLWQFAPTRIHLAIDLILVAWIFGLLVWGVIALVAWNESRFPHRMRQQEPDAVDARDSQESAEVRG